MFDWVELISDALCSQLANYLIVQSFYMAAYLVFVIAYCNVFDSLPIKANVDIHNEPVQFLHPVLSKRKERYGFCIVQDNFVKQFRYILVGKEPKRITREAEQFLSGKARLYSR
jgi:hypothetical protein